MQTPWGHTHSPPHGPQSRDEPSQSGAGAHSNSAGGKAWRSPRRKRFRTLVVIRHFISKKGVFLFSSGAHCICQGLFGIPLLFSIPLILLPSVPVFLLFLLKKVPTLCTVPARGGLPAGGGGPQASEPPEGQTIVHGRWGRTVATT